MATWDVEQPRHVTVGATTTRVDGDFAIDAEPAGLAARRSAIVARPWVWLRQVHGAEVVVVTADNAADVCGAEADALVTADPDLVLAVQTADCVPITFTSASPVFAVAHAGWRGLEAGVVERTIETMRELGAETVNAAVGPHIGPECYEFGAADLDRLAAGFGSGVRSFTSEGAPALDLTQMSVAALRRGGLEEVDIVHVDRRCTACRAATFFSHRARGEQERMATAMWRQLRNPLISTVS
jgi:polyphenol oxidase